MTNLVRRAKAGPKRILAVASGGGHWQQLMLLRGGWQGCDVRYATTLAGLDDAAPGARITVVPDCNRNTRVAILRCALALGVVILRFRPAVVVTTGALPGLLALTIARWIGARTVWIDSVANAEEMSLAGRSARKRADLWLSQWPDVAAAEGAGYAGSVL